MYIRSDVFYRLSRERAVKTGETTHEEAIKMYKDTRSADYANITTGQQETWSNGDFNEIARQNVVMSEALCEAVDPHPGQRVLDVACGSGTAALVAERRYCEVTGLDYVPGLIERAKTRAQANGQDIDFHVGDAQDMAFPDNSFDVVLSVYGYSSRPIRDRRHVNCFGCADQVAKSAWRVRFPKGGAATGSLLMPNISPHLLV